MRPVALVVVAACGRVGFDASPRAADAATDAVDAANIDLCAARSYELCDGFEQPGFATYWTVGTAFTLDTTVAHRGTQSAHSHLPALAAGVGGYSELIEMATIAQGDTMFYVRAYLRLGALPVDGNALEVVAAETPNSAREDAIFLKATDLEVYEQWTDQATGNNVPPPIDTWFCVLWTVERSSASGTLVLAGDVPGATLTGVPTDGSPTLADMAFGLQLAPTNQTFAQPALDLWIDDVIVDKSPLTCAD